MINFFNISTKIEYDKYMNYLLSLPKDNNIYTNEYSLKNILLHSFKLSENELIHNKQIIKNGYKFRPDYKFDFNNKTFIVEFNGYQHFTDPKVMYKDYLKRIIFNTDNHILVEIPYFIQINKDTFEYFFKVKAVGNIPDNTFPHGFIHPKSKSLGEFSTRGKMIANEIISTFPINMVKDYIHKSLLIRSKYEDIPIEYLT